MTLAKQKDRAESQARDFLSGMILQAYDIVRRTAEPGAQRVGPNKLRLKPRANPMISHLFVFRLRDGRPELSM